MAEAWVNELRSSEWLAFSAGIETHGMNPHAVAVMSESGVDMSNQYSKTIEEFNGLEFDLIVTVCDHAAESCPVKLPSLVVKHIPFEDPPKMAQQVENEHDSLMCYRQVRDQIKSFIESPALSA